MSRQPWPWEDAPEQPEPSSEAHAAAHAPVALPDHWATGPTEADHRGAIERLAGRYVRQTGCTWDEARARSVPHAHRWHRRND